MSKPDLNEAKTAHLRAAAGEERASPVQALNVAPIRPASRTITYLLLGLLSTLLSALIINHGYIYVQRLYTARQTVSLGMQFDWKDITPTPDLMWVDCYPGRQCARLEVPFDYGNPVGEKAAIALLRVKSKLPPGSDEYRGPVLFNPGGPGGSGVDFIHTLGEVFQRYLGEEYDIVGFDPRGIGQTTPSVSSFSDQWERAYWDSGAAPLPNSSSDSIPRAYARSKLFGELGEARTKHAAQHVSTAVVARDMLTITNAHGRDRLLYWGFSYGSVLGATYAAIFPNNVERLIIDGVVDFDDYYSGSWSKNLYDTDKVLQYLYDKCVEAGPTDCPLYANTTALVQERVEAVFTSIKANPFPILDATGYDIIDYSILKLGLFVSLYSPFALLRNYAGALAALENGDGRLALAFLKLYKQLPKCDSPLLPSLRKEAQLAVMCGDAEDINHGISDITHYFEELSKVSLFADVLTDVSSSNVGLNRGWKVRAKERFTGPFEVNTSFPIMIIGNTADPVTPLIGAQKAAKTFNGSALLTINTPGHCSLAASSICTTKAIRRYFRDGELPEKGLVCEIEDQLFGSKRKTVERLSAEDQLLLEATRSLAQSVPWSRDWYVL